MGFVDTCIVAVEKSLAADPALGYPSAAILLG